MFSLTVKKTTSTDRIRDTAQKATFKNVGQAAANIRNAARWSIKRSDAPSAAGEPVHSKTGRAKTAVLFAAEKDSAVIGFAASIIGTGMQGWEMGGRVSGRKETFQKRPVMWPALQRNLGRFAADWEGGIGD